MLKLSLLRITFNSSEKNEYIPSITLDFQTWGIGNYCVSMPLFNRTKVAEVLFYLDKYLLHFQAHIYVEWTGCTDF